MPDGAEDGILRGMYLLQAGGEGGRASSGVQLLGSGTILREVIAAAELLEEDFGVTADIWSVPSFTELRRDGLAAERWNMLHPAEPRRQSYVETSLAARPDGPVVAATDYMKAFADQIRPYVPPAIQGAGHRRLRPLATTGATCVASSRSTGTTSRSRRCTAWPPTAPCPAATVADAIARYGLEADKPNPPEV